PYRWLEDDNSEATDAWVEEQNKVTFDYLKQIPYHNKIKDRLEEIWNYPKYSSPFKVAGKYYFKKNDGLQNQSVLYTQNDLYGEPEVLLDPNTFCEDGTISLSGTYFSNDGKYMGYSKCMSGSDWNEFFIMDLNTRENLDDHLEWIKFLRELCKFQYLQLVTKHIKDMMSFTLLLKREKLIVCLARQVLESQHC
ncbi:unnamed protein product, partial [marine sediment metagenome]